MPLSDQLSHSGREIEQFKQGFKSAGKFQSSGPFDVLELREFVHIAVPGQLGHPNGIKLSTGDSQNEVRQSKRAQART